jgi:N-acetylmuramoyl-L-alanine amidase
MTIGPALKLWVLCTGLALGTLAQAQDLTALARVDAQASFVEDRGDEVVAGFALSQAVPWRLRVLASPPRLVLDMREADWAGIAALRETSAHVVSLRAGPLRPGWSRLVIELDQPMLVDQAGMVTQGQVRLSLTLRSASAEEFAEMAAMPEPKEWALPKAADFPAMPQRGDGPLIVVLDPGHGGIDPGAESGGLKEADLMLTFARDLKEILLRDTRFTVVLTRETDIFVPLEERSTLARAMGAGVFLSLHADAIAEGVAVGATIYTLSDEASDAAARALAERHDRDDLLAGIDLTQQDDLVAMVLMDMARTETTPRILRLADALEAAIKGAGLKMHSKPQQEAGFSVLKSPDIPSVLVELGFLSSDLDRARLTDADWRAKMAGAIRDGLAAWDDEDRAIAGLGQP